MLKILWVCNTPLPEIQYMFGIKNYNEGWLAGISNQLRKKEDIVFHYAFPQNRFKKTVNKTIDGITFWGFFNYHENPYEVRKENISALNTIIKKINPDIIHIFGTEFAHSLECMYTLSNKKNVIVSLQGLTSALARVYTKEIPIRDQLAGGIEGNKYRCILAEKFEFYKRGKNEIKVLSSANNVIGRTKWDRNYVKRLNPRCKYYHCNETLRDVFYEGDWELEKIQRYSIFVSQGNYPIKGLHILISALPIIKNKYPDVMVYVAGNKEFIKAGTPYGCYIKKMLKKYQVEENVIFVGFLTGEKVKQRLLRTHIALMPSLLENSPNSIGEAMILGTPVVAAKVGGIPTILHDKTEGFLYSCTDKNELAEDVCKIFSNDNLAIQFSENGKKAAKKLYDKSYNLKQLLKIYKTVNNEKRPDIRKIRGFIGAGAMKRVSSKSASKTQTMSDKHLALFLMMNRWVQVKQEGKCLEDYFEKHGYKSIAIYGMSYAGERLLDELKGADTTVKYGIDKEADAICADIPVVFPEDSLEEVDAIVVTSIYFIDEIEKNLSVKVSCPIISLEDILYDM